MAGGAGAWLPLRITFGVLFQNENQKEALSDGLVAWALLMMEFFFQIFTNIL